MKQKNRVIYEMQRGEPASEPSYQISKRKVTLTCLGEQLCKVVCRQPGKITSLGLPRKASNGNGEQWSTRKHCLIQLWGLYHGAGRLWDDIRRDDAHQALNWPWQLPAAMGEEQEEHQVHKSSSTKDVVGGGSQGAPPVCRRLIKTINHLILKATTCFQGVRLSSQPKMHHRFWNAICLQRAKLYILPLLAKKSSKSWTLAARGYCSPTGLKKPALVDLAVLGLWLDSMISKVFPNLTNSMILSQAQKATTEENTDAPYGFTIGQSKRDGQSQAVPGGRRQVSQGQKDLQAAFCPLSL